jgi:hypothetical protein
MQLEDDTQPNLKQYKRYERKFPWAFVIRIIAILISMGIIYFLIQQTIAVREEEPSDSFQIEIQTED